MSAEKKLSQEELEKLYKEIMEEIDYIWRCYFQNDQNGIARQKEIVRKIDEHPEVLRVKKSNWSYRTIGIQAVGYGLFYVTMRALQDDEACMLRDWYNDNTYDTIKKHTGFREWVVNSQEYKDLVARLESEVATFDEYDDMSEYDSIME